LPGEERFRALCERYYNRIGEKYGATALEARLSSDVPSLVPLSEMRFNVPPDLQPRLKLLRSLLDRSAGKRFLFVDTKFCSMLMPYCFVLHQICIRPLGSQIPILLANIDIFDQGRHSIEDLAKHLTRGYTNPTEENLAHVEMGL